MTLPRGQQRSADALAPKVRHPSGVSVVQRSDGGVSVRSISADELRAIMEAKPSLRSVRHITINPEPNWKRIANALCIAAGVGALVYFVGRLLVAWVA